MNKFQRQSNGRWALITGASAGIGKAFATVFARNGFNLVLVARREDKLKSIAAQMEKSFEIQTKVLVFDLANPVSTKQVYDSLKADQIMVSALVNNAGYALKTKFLKTSWQDHQDMIQVMMTAVTQMCYLFADEMKKQKYGRIINVASVAAFSPQMPGNLYGGIKSYVAGISDALHMELSGHGINCTALCPGFTRSEFHDVMGVRESIDKLPKFMWSTAEDVAEQGYQAVMKGKVFCIPGGFYKVLTAMMGFFPKSFKSWMGKRSR
jgi:uncharacterized protein